jgi:hypothetical protein
MILSITDGIEVAEHTEPMERAKFLREFRLAQFRVASETHTPDMSVFLRRQAE